MLRHTAKSLIATALLEQQLQRNCHHVPPSVAAALSLCLFQASFAQAVPQPVPKYMPGWMRKDMEKRSKSPIARAKEAKYQRSDRATKRAISEVHSKEFVPFTLSFQAPPSPDASTAEEGGSWMPNWVSKWLPGSRKQERQLQQSPLQLAQPKGQHKQHDDDAWEEAEIDERDFKDLDKHMINPDLDKFLLHKQQESSPHEPIPRTPRYGRLDIARIIHLHNKQMLAITESLTEGEKAFIQADPDNALKDEALLQQIAGRHNCGVSGVREHIREYKQWRDEMTAIAEIAKEHKEGVRALPRTKVAMHARVEEKLKQKKHDAVRALLEKRDLQNCPIRSKLKMLAGKETLCPNTRLLYRDCCGCKDATVSPSSVAGQTT
eukprot:jgi/Chrzof1/7574/Cz02g28270.t1